MKEVSIECGNLFNARGDGENVYFEGPDCSFKFSKSEEYSDTDDAIIQLSQKVGTSPQDMSKVIKRLQRWRIR